VALSESAGAAFVSSPSNTVTSAAYTPNAGSLQVAICAAANPAAATVVSASCTGSVSGAWTLKASNVVAGQGAVYVFMRDATGIPAAETVTFTVLPSSVVTTAMIVKQFAGALLTASQPGVTSSSAADVYQLAITPGTTGSQVVGALGYDNAQTFMTANGATVLYGQSNPLGTVALYEASALSTSGTPVTVGCSNTAPSTSDTLLNVEVLPAPLPPAVTAGQPSKIPPGRGSPMALNRGFVHIPTAPPAPPPPPTPTIPHSLVPPGRGSPRAWSQLQVPQVSTAPVPVYTSAYPQTYGGSQPLLQTSVTPAPEPPGRQSPMAWSQLRPRAPQSTVPPPVGIQLVKLGAVNAGLTPAYGQPTTSGDLLILWLWSNDTTATNPFTVTGTGWALATAGGAASEWSAIYYRPACGAGESPPTISGSGGSTYFSQLGEFSGAALTAVLDQTGFNASSFATAQTATCGAANTAPGDLIILDAMWNGGVTGPTTITTTLTDSGGNPVTANTTSNPASSGNFYAFTWGVAGSNGAANTTGTSTLGSIESGSACIATFVSASAPPPPPLTSAAPLRAAPGRRSPMAWSQLRVTPSSVTLASSPVAEADVAAATDGIAVTTTSSLPVVVQAVPLTPLVFPAGLPQVVTAPLTATGADVAAATDLIVVTAANSLPVVVTAPVLTPLLSPAAAPQVVTAPLSATQTDVGAAADTITVSQVNALPVVVAPPVVQHPLTSVAAVPQVVTAPLTAADADVAAAADAVAVSVTNSLPVVVQATVLTPLVSPAPSPAVITGPTAATFAAETDIAAATDAITVAATNSLPVVVQAPVLTPLVSPAGPPAVVTAPLSATQPDVAAATDAIAVTQTNALPVVVRAPVSLVPLLTVAAPAQVITGPGPVTAVNQTDVGAAADTITVGEVNSLPVVVQAPVLVPLPPTVPQQPQVVTAPLQSFTQDVAAATDTVAVTQTNSLPVVVAPPTPLVPLLSAAAAPQVVLGPAPPGQITQTDVAAAADAVSVTQTNVLPVVVPVPVQHPLTSVAATPQVVSAPLTATGADVGAAADTVTVSQVNSLPVVLQGPVLVPLISPAAAPQVVTGAALPGLITQADVAAAADVLAVTRANALPVVVTAAVLTPLGSVAARPLVVGSLAPQRSFAETAAAAESVTVTVTVTVTDAGAAADTWVVPPVITYGTATAGTEGVATGTAGTSGVATGTAGTQVLPASAGGTQGVASSQGGTQGVATSEAGSPP
jgi:hypothetical protein